MFGIKGDKQSIGEIIGYHSNGEIVKPLIQRKKCWTFDDNYNYIKHLIQFRFCFSPLILHNIIINDKEYHSVIDGNNRLNAILHFNNYWYNYLFKSSESEYFKKIKKNINKYNDYKTDIIKFFIKEIEINDKSFIFEYENLYNCINLIRNELFLRKITLFEFKEMDYDDFKIDDEKIDIFRKNFKNIKKMLKKINFDNIDLQIIIIPNNSKIDIEKLFSSINKNGYKLTKYDIISSQSSKTNYHRNVFNDDIFNKLIIERNNYYKGDEKDDEYDVIDYTFSDDYITSYHLLISLQNYLHNLNDIFPNANINEKNDTFWIYDLFIYYFPDFIKTQIDDLIINNFINDIIFLANRLIKISNKIDNKKFHTKTKSNKNKKNLTFNKKKIFKIFECYFDNKNNKKFNMDNFEIIILKELLFHEMAKFYKKQNKNNDVFDYELFSSFKYSRSAGYCIKKIELFDIKRNKDLTKKLNNLYDEIIQLKYSYNDKINLFIFSIVFSKEMMNIDEIDIDHIIPRTENKTRKIKGSDRIGNLYPLDRKINRARKNNDMSHDLIKREGLTDFYDVKLIEKCNNLKEYETLCMINEKKLKEKFFKMIEIKIDL